MSNTILLVPTRARTHNVQEFIDCIVSSLEEDENLDLFFLWDDDEALDTYADIYRNNRNRHTGLHLEFVRGKRERIIPRLNTVLTWLKIVSYPEPYKYYCFGGDDHRFRTKGWLTKMQKTIGEIGVVYGDDKLQGEELATAFMVSANIINTLGYFAPPGLEHMFMDNWIMEVGKRVDSLHYLPDVIIEHMHFSVGKSIRDDSYVETNLSNMLYTDRVIYDEYMQNGFATDVEKLIKLKESI